ncbi:MAG: flagellar hook capping FlgD N-terminal domain-containing protein [Planctomycetaceae bacterium]
MAVGATQGTGGSSSNPVDSTKTGFSGLTSDDFLKMLITQLQYQDPTNPMESDQLLQQISQMQSLQSNLSLSDSIKSLTLSQQLTSATSFLGKQVAGTDANNNQLSGTVSSVVVNNGSTYLGIGDSQMPLANVTNVTGQ